MKQLKTYIVCLFAMLSLSSSAQCTFRNTAFSSGEYLTYNLYYNWKLYGLRQEQLPGILSHQRIKESQLTVLH